MELSVLLGLLLFLLAIGVPVAFSLMAATLVTFVLLDIPVVVLLQRMSSGMSIFSLMAIPFFVFAGDLMYRAGIAERLVRVADGIFGRAQGGLGQVTVGASMMFGAVSGSAIASASAMGAALNPLMRERGYDADYGANITSTAAIVGLLIPPSHNMIIYAAASGIGLSVGNLFLAGVVPGVLTGMALMVVAWLVAKKRGYEKGIFPGWRSLAKSFIWAIPGLMTAIIILGGILSGIFTATESSAIAVIYTILVGALVYRTLGLAKFLEAAKQSVKITAMVLLIISAATGFSFALAILKTPTQLGELITSVTDNPILILLMMNVILLLLGTFMDMSPLIIIMTPILLPVAMSVGIDPTHFGIIMILNLGIGLVTPPVGAVLFVGSAVGNVTVEEMVKTIWPFYGALIVALLVITLFPALSMTLPNIFGS